MKLSETLRKESNDFLNCQYIDFSIKLDKLAVEAEQLEKQNEELIELIKKDRELICQNCQQKDYRRCWKEKEFCKTYDERIEVLKDGK